MALQIANLPLDPDDGGPTLADGALFLAASGGLPARVQPLLFRETSGIAIQRFGIAVEPSLNLVAFIASSGVVVRNYLTGGTQWTAATLPFGIRPYDADSFVASGTGTTIKRYRWTDGTVLETITSGFSNTLDAVFVGGNWHIVGFSNSALTEVDTSSTPTGRTVGSVYTSCFTDGTRLWAANGSGIDEISLATYSVINSSPGAGFATGYGYDFTNDRIIVYYSGSATTKQSVTWIDKELAAFGDAMIHGGVRLYGGTGEASNAATAACHSKSGIFAMPLGTPVGVSGNTFNAIQVEAENATSQWEWSPPFGQATVKHIVVPGALSYGQSDILAADSGKALPVDEQPRCSLYYAVDGGARVQFEPGELLDIEVSSQLLVDVDFHSIERIDGAPAWVGDATGTYGPRVIYDGPLPLDQTPTSSAASDIRDRLIAIIEGDIANSLATLVPRSKIDRPFRHRDAHERLEAENRGGINHFRRFTVLPIDPFEELAFFGQDQAFREQDFEIEVAYPNEPRFYGDRGYRDLDRIREEDYEVIRNAISRPDNWLSSMQQVTVAHDVDEDEDRVTMTITATVKYTAESTQ